MYDAIRLFYANGGGKCYIISIGAYDANGNMTRTDFEDGLEELKKKDEPTLILFPDAVKLTTETDLYELQKQALSQCNELQDRFGIFDTYYDGVDKATFDASIENLRSNIGVNNLKYGAVYAPWIKSQLPRDFTYADFHDKLTKLGAPIKLSSITSTTDAAIKGLIEDYDFLLTDRKRINDNIEVYVGNVTGDVTNLPGNLALVLKNYEGDLNDFKLEVNVPVPVLADVQTAYQALIDRAYELIELLDTLLETTNIVTEDLNNDVFSKVTSFAANPAFTTLVTLDNTIDSASGYIGTNTNYTRKSDTTLLADITIVSAWVNTALRLALNVAATDPLLFHHNVSPATLTTQQRIDNMSLSEPAITKALLAAFEVLKTTVDSVNNAIKTKEDSLYNAYLIYKNIRDYVNKELTLLPPSGAVAGIYAYVDANRGVWKAPANVSLANVLAPSIGLTDKDQETLNIDVNSGKSVNAIRYFTGKGNLVWGARTLAGNDNEWRYVSVRRFFNMVEESVKKSTSWAVFEPNDAGTWIKVKGMIDNFLALQWRNGALQGAKPAEAYYVKIGLGETMTSLDILEGRMNVEIGMAVVRPAEFIVLTFSHMLATS
ncbi:phage tail protein [Pseudochryseolinea flava]|uniref:Phage tail protein n=2 Tax=Pseudochryseolinea flava TaxID=2059302 RepID=A0A364Y6A9_9BACT|nr:phage tail protein [Pseudochryseolinea flava]